MNLSQRKKRIKSRRRVLSSDMIEQYRTVMILVFIALSGVMVFIGLMIYESLLTALLGIAVVPTAVIGLIAFYVRWKYVRTTTARRNWAIFITALLVTSGATLLIAQPTGVLFTVEQEGPGIDPITLLLLTRPPAPRVPTGMSMVRLYDPINGTYFNNREVRLYHYENGSYYGSVLSNNTFRLNQSTIAFINLTGYHLSAESIEGSGKFFGDPVINTMYLYREANNNSMIFRIMAIDGDYSKTHIDNVTDGRRTIRFEVINLEFSANYTIWGWGEWLPEDSFQHKALTVSLRINGTRAWMCWNGSISNIIYKTPIGDPFTPLVYDVGSYNVSAMLCVYDRAEFSVTADFKNLTSVHLCQGFIDNYNIDIVQLS